MSHIKLQKIVIYPIKACGGIEVQEACIEERGLEYDRRWMLIDAQGTHLDQLRQPRLASIKPLPQGGCLSVNAPDMPPLHVPLSLDRPTTIAAKVMNSFCEVAPVGPEADAWFSQLLGIACRLVYMPDSTRRPVNPKYAFNHEIVNFASGYQFHILGEASLEALNQMLEIPVPINRFRPNLIVAGSPAFAEDGWHTIYIGEHAFHLVKPCARCAITTVDQERGEVTGKEPLRMLSHLRTANHKVLFGQYAMSSARGRLRVGDDITVLQEKEPVVFRSPLLVE